jgi:NAD(P)-dependent dehydrogenase (short-subunit alcohol dehydrogenase family)
MASFSIQKIYEIAGRQAIVTGGGSGIGQMICQGFVANNVDVAVVDKFQERIDETIRLCLQIKEEVGSTSVITSLCYDIGDEDSNTELVKKINTSYDCVDILINCAGIRRQNRETFTPGESLEKLHRAANSISWKDFRDTFDVNVFGMYFLTAGLVSKLGEAAAKGEGRGCVICFSSPCSVHNNQFVPTYQLSKVSIDHMVRIMAAEFADKYIRVNAISPGLYASRMTPMAPNDPSSNMKYVHLVPARRAGTPEEMVSAVIFLCSKGGAYMDGRNLRMDGGRLLTLKGHIYSDE